LEVSATCRTKEETTDNRLRAMGVGALITLNCCHLLVKDDGKPTDWHPVRELLGTGSLKEGKAGAVGE
jgi:hypothetical protein